MKCIPNMVRGRPPVSLKALVSHAVGPIVRIAPNEIHLADPDNYDKIYSVSSEFYKDPAFYETLGVDVMFSTISNDEHRRRRAPLSHFFSRRAVLDLEDIVQEKVAKLCRRIQKSLDSNRPANLRASTRAVSIDVITEYAFDDCWNHLDAEDYAAWFSEAVRDTGIMWWTFQQFPILMKPMQLVPENYARKMSSAMNGWIDCVVRTREYVMRVNEQFKAGIKPNRRTIFHELLDPSSNSDEACPTPDIERLYGEASRFAQLPLTPPVMQWRWLHIMLSPTLTYTTNSRKSCTRHFQTRIPL